MIVNKINICTWTRIVKENEITHLILRRDIVQCF